MHAPIINTNNVHALFKLNVSAFEALHVDINFKMHKFAVFDHGRGGGGVKNFRFPQLLNLRVHTLYILYVLDCVTKHPQYLIPVETFQHLFVSSILNKSFISNHDRHAKHKYIHNHDNCVFHAKSRI